MATSLGNPVDLSGLYGPATTAGTGAYGTSADQMNWAKSQFAKNQATSDTITGRALDTGSNFGDWAKQDRATYNQYKPIARQQRQFAQSYGTPQRMQANRTAAMAGSQIASNAGADAAKRSLMSYGVDPSAGRFAGLDAGLAAKAAATSAAAGTKSDRDTEMMAENLRRGALAQGNILPGQSVNEAGLGIAAGNQAINTGLATTASGAATMGTPLQWGAQGTQDLDSASRMLLGQTSLGLQQNRDVAQQRLEQEKIDQQSSSGLGAAIGGIAGLGSNILSKYMGGFGGSGGGVGTGTPGSGTINNVSSGGYTSASLGTQPGIQPQDPGNYYSARGGRVPPARRRYRVGGFVHNDSEVDDRPIHREPYRPDDEPVGRYDGGGSVGGGDPLKTAMGMAGSVLGMLIPIPVVGPMIGHFAGQAGADLIEGHSDQIGSDAVGDIPFSNLFKQGFGGGGGGGGGGAAAGGMGMASAGDMGGLPDMAESGFSFAEGGAVDDYQEPDDLGGMDDYGGDGGDGDPTSGVSSGDVVPPEASPSGGENVDDVHALVSEGEFIIPKVVTSWYGEKFLQNLVKKAYDEMSQPKVAEAEVGPTPQAMAISPPTFKSRGTMGASA